MVSYLFQAPTGVPGDITRSDETNVEPAMLVAASTVFAQAFGIPMKYVAGGIQQFNGGAETKADFAGVLIREVPQQAGVGDTGQFSGTLPNPLQPQGLAVRGYVSVKCVTGTPARGGVVYIQIIAAGGFSVGDFRASADGGNTIALDAVQAEWATDGVDADLNAELRIAR
jgi:hypothetical protein